MSELNEKNRTENKVADDINGLLVVEVESGSSAEDKQIRAGEIVVQINQEPVLTLDEAKEQVKALESKGSATALVMISTPTGDIRFVVVRMD